MRDVRVTELVVCYVELIMEGEGQELVQDRASRGAALHTRVAPGLARDGDPAPRAAPWWPGRAEQRHREGLGAGQVNLVGCGFCVKLHGWVLQLPLRAPSPAKAVRHRAAKLGVRV